MNTRTVLSSLIGFVAAFVLVASVGVFSDPLGEAPAAARERPQGCCLTMGEDPDASSAEFQQVIANAVVQNGAELRNFNAPRPIGDARIRRLTAIVTFVGDQQSVAKTLERLAEVSPSVAVSRVRIEREGERFLVTGQFAQWVRLESRT